MAASQVAAVAPSGALHRGQPPALLQGDASQHLCALPVVDVGGTVEIPVTGQRTGRDPELGAPALSTPPPAVDLAPRPPGTGRVLQVLAAPGRQLLAGRRVAAARAPPAGRGPDQRSLAQSARRTTGGARSERTPADPRQQVQHQVRAAVHGHGAAGGGAIRHAHHVGRHQRPSVYDNPAQHTRALAGHSPRWWRQPMIRSGVGR